MAKKSKKALVVLVNDEPQLSKLLCALLEEQGLRVSAHESVEDALSFLNEHGAPALIVTDLHMPVIDGWQFCRMLRSQEYPAFNDVPILVVSSTFSGADAEEMTADLGANAFLPAPFKGDMLKSYVSDLLSGKPVRLTVDCLIVEDDEAQAKLFAHSFKTARYAVRLAGSGKEAQRLFKKRTPAVAVIDYRLPDMDGSDLLKQFKDSNAETVVVVITGDATPELALHLTRNGADAYVRKPFDPEYLVTVCEQARRRQALLRVEQLLMERTQELQESERKYRLLLDAVPESVLVHDDTGEILHINEVGAGRLELPAEQIIGKNIREFLTPENARRVSANVRRVRADGAHRFETVYVSAAGNQIQVEVNERLVDFQGQRVVLSIGRDVTARKEAEGALRENEERLRGILSSLYETAIVVFDPDGTYVACWTPAELDQRYGIRGSDLVGKHLSKTSIGGEGKDRLRAVRRVVESRKSCREEYEVHYPGGDFWHDMTLSPMLDGDGQVSAVVGFVRDVTEYKRSQGALWDLSALLETTFDAIPDAISIQDIDRRVIRCNRAGYKFFNITPGETIGRKCYELVGRTEPCETCVTSAVVETKQPAQTEAYLENLGLWVDLRAYPVLDDTGNVVKIIEHMRDITERKRAEETMREAERFLASVFASIQDGISVLDTTLTVVRVNPTMEKWYAHNMPLVGRKCHFAYQCMETPCEDCPAQRTMATGRTAYQVKPKRGVRGEIVGWLELYSFPMMDISTGQMKGVIIYSRDITGRRATEAERVRLSTAVSQAAEAIIVTNREGVIEFVNPAFEQITGYRAEEVIGKNPRFLKSGQHDKAYYEEMWQTILSGKVWRGAFINKKKDGTVYEEDATISPVRGESGEISNFVAVKRDVTEELQLEQQLRQAQKMEAIGNLAGGVAHDFNNLLTGILGYANMLKSFVKPGENVYEAAQIIEKAAHRAAELTQQLLDFARKTKRQNVLVDLHAIVKEVCTLLSRTIVKTIEIRQELKAESAWILGDPGQMQQVILNFAVNARDAMPEGGKLQFASELKDLDEDFCARCGLEKPGRYLLITVTDTGCGIPKHVQDRIFEPFFTTKDKKGTGMGLAMAYSTIKDHGGSISVYSEVDVGTTFRLYLPLASGPTSAYAAAAAQRVVKGTGHILVVDDEEIVRDVATRILANLGYDVHSVKDGQEAVDYYKEHATEVDLVIIDMIMPVVDGPDCFRALKKINPEVRAILSTGYGLDDAGRELLSEGVLAIAQKPYQMNQLSAIVAEKMSRPSKPEPSPPGGADRPEPPDTGADDTTR